MKKKVMLLFNYHLLNIPSFWTFGQQRYKNESIHSNSWHHSHEKQKDGRICWYFHLKLKYLGLPYREYIKTAKNSSSCEKLLGEKDFETVLVNFCCYGYGGNAFEAVQKSSTRILELYANSLKTVNFVTTPMKKIFSSLLSVYWRYKPGFCFFSWDE